MNCRATKSVFRANRYKINNWTGRGSQGGCRSPCVGQDKRNLRGEIEIRLGRRNWVTDSFGTGRVNFKTSRYFHRKQRRQLCISFGLSETVARTWKTRRNRRKVEETTSEEICHFNAVPRRRWSKRLIDSASRGTSNAPHTPEKPKDSSW